jgi:hypothetical protein
LKFTEEKDEKACRKIGRGVWLEREQDIKVENLSVINCTENNHVICN